MAFALTPAGASSLDNAFMSAMPAARLTELGSLAPPGALAAIARVKRIEPLVARSCGSSQAGEPYRRHQLQLQVGLPRCVVDGLDRPEERPRCARHRRCAPRVTASTSARGPRGGSRQPAAPGPAAARFHQSRGRTRSSSRPQTATDAPSSPGGWPRRGPARPYHRDEHDLAAELEIHVSLLRLAARTPPRTRPLPLRAQAARSAGGPLRAPARPRSAAGTPCDGWRSRR